MNVIYVGFEMHSKLSDLLEKSIGLFTKLDDKDNLSQQYRNAVWANYNAKRYTPVGIFSGFIGGMAQDKNGFIWLAGKGGLIRYDGYRNLPGLVSIQSVASRNPDFIHPIVVTS